MLICYKQKIDCLLTLPFTVSYYTMPSSFQAFCSQRKPAIIAELQSQYKDKPIPKKLITQSLKLRWSLLPIQLKNTF